MKVQIDDERCRGARDARRDEDDSEAEGVDGHARPPGAILNR